METQCSSNGWHTLVSFILYNKLALYLLQGVHGPRPPIPHEAEMHPDLQHIINGNRQKFMADAVGPMVRLLSILPSVFFFCSFKNLHYSQPSCETGARFC